MHLPCSVKGYLGHRTSSCQPQRKPAQGMPDLAPALLCLRPAEASGENAVSHPNTVFQGTPLDL